MPGQVFAPNLTSDPETGLGAIPDDAVARAIREGVSHDGRALFMMPWQNYRSLSDEDVASVVAYLRALPPVKKARGTTAIQAPVRWFLKAGPEPLAAPVTTAIAADPVARGRQLAEIGQCQSCHTPVDARHQPLPGMAYAGGQAFTIDGVRYRSSNITPDASGISYYNEELFIRTMRTGNVGGRRLAPIMPWADIRKLTDDDLKALWAYLRTVTPVAHEVERAPVELKDNPAFATAPTTDRSSTATTPTRRPTMRIHHFTVPARDPARVAAVLAEVLGARVIPLPHPVGTLLVYAGDSDGTAIEIWPAGTRGRIGAAELHVTELPLPEDWPHHGYVTTDATDADQVLAIFAREGWRAERVQNGPPGSGLQPGARVDREPHRHRDRRPPDARGVRAVLRPGWSARRNRRRPASVRGDDAPPVALRRPRPAGPAARRSPPAGETRPPPRTGGGKRRGPRCATHG